METTVFHTRKRKRRKLFSIRIDPEVWETAKELGLNMSRTFEECLKQAIHQLQNTGNHTVNTSKYNKEPTTP